MNIFKDNNEYNEKSIIGAVAFIIMCLVMILDLVTGWLDRDLAINEFVYDIESQYITCACDLNPSKTSSVKNIFFI